MAIGDKTLQYMRNNGHPKHAVSWTKYIKEGGPEPSYEALKAKAREVMTPEAYDYVAGGAGSEDTMRANREAFRRWRIVPRLLRDVTGLPVMLAEDPLTAIAIGTGRCLDEMRLLKEVTIRS